MSQRIETRRHARRAASKEALKQLQLLTAADDDDSTETYEITSDEDVVAVEMPPKKKYRLSHRKSSDGNDRDVLVLKTIRHGEETLSLEAFPEDLSPVQLALHEKIDKELQEMNSRIDQIMKQTGAQILYQGEACTMLQVGEPPSLTYTGLQPQSNLLLQGQKGTNNYQLVMDPRLGLIVGTMTPTPAPAALTTTPTTQQTTPNIQTRQTRKRGRPSSLQRVNTPQTNEKQLRHTKSPSAPAAQMRPTESTAVGGLSTGSSVKSQSASTVVDLTADDGRPLADSREISFNKLQGKTFPSLVVVARPHLRVKDSSGGDRGRLDAKVKAVLMHVPTKFTEWLIQQGLVRSEQMCCIHDNSKLKLGMYSDVSKFPYSGGYVWISECCPQRFVSVFSGSLFEGSPHPPSVILKLIYHWACQTNVQNVVQWVKVDNLYVKGLNTWLRAACTVALHTHIAPLGGPGCKVEVGVISLGTTSQDGHQRQVKVEVLGLLETENKLVRLRAVEPLADGDRNYRKRFSKILEPIVQWVHPESIIVTDLTVDKGTLHAMGFKHVQQTTSTDHNNSNRTIMEYLRRIVPRMFQNTLSLLSRQIIQQFLDELVWREWFGTTAVHAFDNMVIHLSQQTRCDTGQSLIVRLNKVAANPFKNWSIASYLGNATPVNNKVTAGDPAPTKRYGATRRTRIPTAKAASPVQDAAPATPKPPRSVSPDVHEQMVPLENYYYGTISGSQDANAAAPVTLNLKCCMCRAHFTNNVKLMTHLFSHAHSVASGAQQCKYCLASVTTADGLAKHVASAHPFETKFGDAYACVICETRFQNAYILGKHMSKEHSPAELPYMCGTCGYRCSSHKQAVDHFYKSHDGAGTIQCPFCLKSTNVAVNGRMVSQNLSFFLQHLQKHQKKAVAKKCNKCALWFVQKENLKEHQTKMHDSQRHKKGFVPWVAPRFGMVMAPKSKQDRQPVEEKNINYATIEIDAPSHLLCKECKAPLTAPQHFPCYATCSNNNCQYSTCCAAALKTHATMCRDLNSSLPYCKLPYEMYCVCGYSDTEGNTLAKHLALCERRSAYPSAQTAQAASVTHSMLDVLGLVRRPEEPAEAKQRKEDESKAESSEKEDNNKAVEDATNEDNEESDKEKASEVVEVMMDEGNDAEGSKEEDAVGEKKNEEMEADSSSAAEEKEDENEADKDKPAEIPEDSAEEANLETAEVTEENKEAITEDASRQDKEENEADENKEQPSESIASPTIEETNEENGDEDIVMQEAANADNLNEEIEKSGDVSEEIEKSGDVNEELPTTTTMTTTEEEESVSEELEKVMKCAGEDADGDVTMDDSETRQNGLMDD